jgi:adenylate cyclase
VAWRLSAEAAWVVVAPGSDSERAVPISGRLFVGRECAGITPTMRLIIDRPSVSRDHLELRTSPSGETTLIDLSTNGTRVNGRPVERGEAIALRDADLIELGGVEMLFRSAATDQPLAQLRATLRTQGIRTVAVVVGDVISYTELTERLGARVVADAVDALFVPLRSLVTEHHGTISNFAGDALFAAWDAGRDPQAAVRAVRFVQAAHRLVSTQSPELDISRAGQGTIEMGWAVTLGEAATGRPTPGRAELHGDPVNLAFRLSGLAGRDGRGSVLVAEDAVAATAQAASYEFVGALSVRGRTAPVRVHTVRLD